MRGLYCGIDPLALMHRYDFGSFMQGKKDPFIGHDRVNDPIGSNLSALYAGMPSLRCQAFLVYLLSMWLCSRLVRFDVHIDEICIGVE